MLNATRQTPSSLGTRIRLAIWTLFVLGLPASAEDVRPDDWRARGAAFEKRNAWAEACRCYEDILRKERGNVIARGQEPAVDRPFDGLEQGVIRSDGYDRARKG